MTNESSSATTKRSWVQGYYPAFDGLRAVAILSVFYCHYGPPADSHLKQWGSWSGVDLFFVLSGFLITGILYDSRETRQYFRRFYERRALRILPLIFGLFLLILLLTPILHITYSDYIWTVPLFVENFFVKGSMLGRHGNPTLLHLHLGPNRERVVGWGHLWSLCVEEQFYLVWPWVVWLMPSRTTLMKVCGVGIVWTLVLRTFLYFHNTQAALASGYLYYSTYTRCDTLLVGAWLALWLRGVELSSAELRRRAHWTLWPSVGLLGGLLITFRPIGGLTPAHPVMQTVGFTLLACAAAGVLLLSLDERSTLHRLLRQRWLLFLGRISFGFYVLHFLPTEMFAGYVQAHLAAHHRGLLLVPVTFAVSVAVSVLSFRFWESPFLRLKRRLPSDKEAPAKTQRGARDGLHLRTSRYTHPRGTPRLAAPPEGLRGHTR